MSFVSVDLTQTGAAEELIAAASHRGGIDLLINNVGGATARPGGLASISDDVWRASWDLNVMGVVRPTRAALPAIERRGGGSIVIVSSISAYSPGVTASFSARSGRTRDNLVAAALVRFLDQGVEATTVAEIAADAGVTERTFYRYFPSKHQVLFSDYEARLDWFRVALRVRRAHEPITASVRTAVESFPYDHALRQIAELRAREPQVENINAQLRRVQAAFAHEIEQHLRGRTTPQPKSPRTAFEPNYMRR